MENYKLRFDIITSTGDMQLYNAPRWSVYRVINGEGEFITKDEDIYKAFDEFLSILHKDATAKTRYIDEDLYNNYFYEHSTEDGGTDFWYEIEPRLREGLARYKSNSKD